MKNQEELFKKVKNEMKLEQETYAHLRNISQQLTNEQRFEYNAGWLKIVVTPSP